MYGRLKLAALATILALFAGSAFAAEPLVDTAWVKNHLGKPGIVFLDITSNPDAYAKGHVPGAVFTDYKKDHWRVNIKENGQKVVGMLPPVDHLKKLIGGLGIGNDDQIVIIPNGSSAAEMGTATRIYWTFAVLGHDNVSIMNGGMAAWRADKSNPLETKANKPAPKDFAIHFRKDLIATTDEVKAAMHNGTHLIDSRPVAQNLGIVKSGAVRAFGTIPGAVSVPAEYMTVNNGGEIRDKASLEKLYQMSKAPADGKAITFCNTGHWASLGWFAEYAVMGNKNTRMYDGSLAEWTSDNKAPMERKVNLD